MTLFKPAKREKIKLRLAIEGPSGSGKTYSALLIASGLVGEGGKIAGIDTEHESMKLFADDFRFDHAPLNPPYTPERYMKYLQAAADSGYDCVIIDSLSHAWRGEGGILDIQNNMSGKNDFVKWGKVTPRHESLISAILHSPIHVICTMRSKQAYALNPNSDGKQVPVKLGMAPVQRDGVDYEFTAVLGMMVDGKQHIARGTKDRTKMFPPDRIFTPTEDTGRKLGAWLDDGKTADRPTVNEYTERMQECESQDDLQAVFTEIWSNKQRYSKDDMSQMVSVKDQNKSRLNNIGDEPEPKTPAQAQPETEQEPEESIPTPAFSENVDALDEMYRNEEYKDTFTRLIDDGTLQIGQVEEVLKSENDQRAADIVALVEKSNGR